MCEPISDPILLQSLEPPRAQKPIAHRPMSSIGDHVQSTTEDGETISNELDFDFEPSENDFAPTTGALQDLFSVAQVQYHCKNQNNFSQAGTKIECLMVEDERKNWLSLDDHGLQNLVNSIALSGESRQRKLLAFFVPLKSANNTSFGCCTTITLDGVKTLFSEFDVDTSFLLDLIGRPNYWAPRKRFERGQDGKNASCSLSVQHPDWNLQGQGKPLSVFMKYNHAKNLTTYIISHKEDDTCVNALRKLIEHRRCIPSQILDDPLDIHVMLSSLSLEVSKYHVKRFQQYMWAQFDRVNGHFNGLDDQGLDVVTKELQVVSSNADSHIANVTVATINASSMQDVHKQLLQTTRDARPSSCRELKTTQRTADAIEYVILSLEKQKMWFLKYKNRKDTTMNVVFNLVTQQNAANNIGIAAEMQKDSSSMSAIAWLTMLFLPGTFTGTLLGAGIFTAVIRSQGIHVTPLWWLWVAVTLPLTVCVLVAWHYYQRWKVASTKFLKQAGQV